MDDKPRKESKELIAARGIGGPAWRWRNAQGAINSPRRSWPVPDPLVRNLTEYLRLQQHRPSRAGRRFPLIAAAVKVHGKAEIARRIELMVMANVEPEEIAGRLDLDVRIIRIYEATFFDVRSNLHAAVWIVCHVLRPLEKAGDYQLSARFRAALGGGRAVLEMLLEDDSEFPVDGNEPLFRMRVKAMALENECLNCAPWDSRTQMKLIQLAHRSNLLSQQIELAEKRLNAKCVAAARAFELERERLAIRKLDAEARLWHAKAQSAGIDCPADSASGGQVDMNSMSLGTVPQAPPAARSA
jgi:hypothetical protein